MVWQIPSQFVTGSGCTSLHAQTSPYLYPTALLITRSIHAHVCAICYADTPSTGYHSSRPKYYTVPAALIHIPTLISQPLSWLLCNRPNFFTWLLCSFTHKLGLASQAKPYFRAEGDVLTLHTSPCSYSGIS
jgi:hypothetical protein